MSLKPKALLEALDFRLSQLWKLDLVVGMAMGAGGAWLALEHQERLDSAVTAAIGLVGFFIGTVVAAAAILGAFLDQAFLRRLKQVGSEPVHYFAPFLFTAFMGVIAALLLLALIALPNGAPRWLWGTLGGIGGLATGWTLGSLVYDLDVVVQFLRLQQAAADVPDEPAERRAKVRPLPKATGRARETQDDS